MKKLIIIMCVFVMVISLQAQEHRIFTHIHNGEVREIFMSEIDSIVFVQFSVPNSSTGVLINGIRWATCNVDAPGTFASAPQSSGMFYQWNRAVGWSSTDPMVNHEEGTEWDETFPTGNSWDEVNNKVCPVGWRLPTSEEQQSLRSSGSLWGEFNGVAGRFFGAGSERLFLPATGYRYNHGGELRGVGDVGEYWSGIAYNYGNAYKIYLDRELVKCEYFYLTFGYSVRCVAEEI
jgi:uncharacterized protein (TIGR02145 family)